MRENHLLQPRFGPFIILICLLLAGCGKDVGRSISGPGPEPLPGPGPGPTDYGDPSELIGWLTVMPSTFHLGERVQIEVGVRNPTSRPILFTSCYGGFIVSNEDGPVLGSIPICDFGPSITSVSPGDSLVARMFWDGRGAQPGKYQVHRVGFEVPDLAPVPIEILDASAN